MRTPARIQNLFGARTGPRRQVRESEWGGGREEGCVVCVGEGGK